MIPDTDLRSEDVDSLAFDKGEGLLPAIVQDATNREVLMLGYMNREAVQETLRRGRVVFFSRSRQQLWEKGETSGNTLEVRRIRVDCDLDTLLIDAAPAGPTCHRDTPTCFGDGALTGEGGIAFLRELESVIAKRIVERPDGSYTAKLLARGTRRMAQKVGEEGVEVALAASAGDSAELVSESADLIFHLMLLLQSQGLALGDVARELAARHRSER